MSDSRHRILIVEDDPLVLAMLAEGLEMSGYAVATAISGENALVLFETIHPDLVVMDICLPGISGIETMQQLREKSDLPVIFLTALNQDETTHEAIKAGAHVYVVKPISLKQLVPMIETALARAADLRKLRTTGENLVTALRQNRDISVAVGILIERHNISGEEAFERLRKHARSTRRRVTEVAASIIAGDTMLD